MEQYAATILIAGLVIGAAGYCWLVVGAFRQRVLWGWAVLFFPPSALVFVPRFWSAAKRPLLVMVVGAMVMVVPYGVNLYVQHFIELGPHEQLVDGELHLTLTGWDGADYSTLRFRSQTVVLQMANPDVDDRTLAYLRGLTRLRELDLNDTQVTDQGLAVLAALPRLETLRLKNTKITDQAFRDHLLAKDTLRELDLRGTAVASKTVRAWKAAQEGRKALR